MAAPPRGAAPRRGGHLGSKRGRDWVMARLLGTHAPSYTLPPFQGFPPRLSALCAFRGSIAVFLLFIVGEASVQEKLEHRLARFKESTMPGTLIANATDTVSRGGRPHR